MPFFGCVNYAKMPFLGRKKKSGSQWLSLFVGILRVG
jgi:hypothetical protein